MYLLILGYKSRKQCILIAKNSNSQNRLSTYVLLALCKSVILLFFLFLFIFFCLFLMYHFAHITFYILIIYVLIFSFFKVLIKYFYLMISILIVICNHVNYKAFDHVNISKFLKFIYQ